MVIKFVMYIPRPYSHFCHKFDLHTVCIYKVFASFWHLTPTNLHTERMHVNCHSLFRVWHVLRLENKKNCMSIETLEIEMTRTARHVTLRWDSRRNCRCQWTFIFVLEKRQPILWISKLNVNWNLSNIHTAYTCFCPLACLSSTDPPENILSSLADAFLPNDQKVYIPTLTLT